MEADPYETAGKEADKSHLGTLPQIVKQIVDRRVYIKQMVRRFPEESTEASDYEQRGDTLKKILVCLYGTTGSYWNPNLKVRRCLHGAAIHRIL